MRRNKRCEPLAFRYKPAIAVGRAAMKTALHATRLRSAFRPASSSPRLLVSCAGSVVARSPMSPAISAAQEAPPVVGIIDSDPVARATLKTLLQPVGVDVVSFDTAESYLLSGSSRSLACLIVDLLLPGMSGLELLRRLRSNGNDVPVILLADESDVPTAVAKNVHSTRPDQALLRYGPHEALTSKLWVSTMPYTTRTATGLIRAQAMSSTLWR